MAIASRSNGGNSCCLKTRSQYTKRLRRLPRLGDKRLQSFLLFATLARYAFCQSGKVRILLSQPCVVFPVLVAQQLKQGFEVTGRDFLEDASEADRFVMNPPFENLQDIDHVRHAFNLLRPSGRIVSVMSQGPFFRSCAKAQDFRQWFGSRGEVIEELTRGTFGVADTQVSAKLILLAL